MKPPLSAMAPLAAQLDRVEAKLDEILNRLRRLEAGKETRRAPEAKRPGPKPERPEARPRSPGPPRDPDGMRGEGPPRGPERPKARPRPPALSELDPEILDDGQGGPLDLPDA